MACHGNADADDLGRAISEIRAILDYDVKMESIEAGPKAMRKEQGHPFDDFFYIRYQSTESVYCHQNYAKFMQPE